MRDMFNPRRPPERTAEDALALASSSPPRWRCPPPPRKSRHYSGRHYDGDLQLYQGFEAATGIKVNVAEGKADDRRAAGG